MNIGNNFTAQTLNNSFAFGKGTVHLGLKDDSNLTGLLQNIARGCNPNDEETIGNITSYITGAANKLEDNIPDEATVRMTVENGRMGGDGAPYKTLVVTSDDGEYLAEQNLTPYFSNGYLTTQQKVNTKTGGFTSDSMRKADTDFQKTIVEVYKSKYMQTIKSQKEHGDSQNAANLYPKALEQLRSFQAERGYGPNS